MMKPRSYQRGFLAAVTSDLRQVVWPRKDQVRAQTIVAIGLLGLLILYICTLAYLIHAALHALGVAA